MEANPDQPTIPKLVYMSFKCKNNGDRVVFGNFMKKITGEMEKFMEAVNEPSVLEVTE